MNRVRLCIVCLLALASACVMAPTEPLPSWNDGAAKQRIVAFVQAVTETGVTSARPAV